jgi:DNA-binding protein HU-beta
MNKKELVSAVAAVSLLTKKDSEVAVNSIIQVITDAVTAGDSVKITGFGVWDVVQKAERQGINPKTLQPILIPAKKAPRFKAGKDFKKVVNNS